MTLLQRVRSIFIATGLALALANASAQTLRGMEAPPENVIHFSASSTLEVTKDLLTVNLQATREGAEASVVQAQLKQVLEAALADAKKSAQPGQLDVRTGQFMIQPRYNREGRISGWVGTAELVLEGRDTARVAQVAGRQQGMNVTSSGYSMSRELREKHEVDLSAQAIQQFRSRATAFAKQFGFPNYVLREVTVSMQEPGHFVPMERNVASMSMKAADASLPTEPGKGVLTAVVQGSVQMLR